MSDDKTILAPIEVPGMQINFQSPIGPSGKVMAFVLGVDALASKEVLDARLDVIAAAVRRQDAGEQLLLDRNHLAANRKLLAKARAARDAAQQMLDGKVTVMSASRRRPVDATQAAPQQVNAVAQHEQRIVEIEGQIAGCEERIPFWEAILRGEDPLEQVSAPKMAAE